MTTTDGAPRTRSEQVTPGGRMHLLFNHPLSSYYLLTAATLLLLVLGLFVFKAFKAGARRVYAPAVLAVTGTCVLVAGKVGGETWNAAAFAGLGLLLLSSFLTVNRNTASAST